MSKYLRKELLSKKNIFLIIVISFATVFCQYCNYSRFDYSTDEMIYMSFQAYSVGYFDYLTFFKLAIYNILPCFMICSFLCTVNKDSHIGLMLRYKNIFNYRNELIRCLWIFDIIYVLLSVLIYIGTIILLQWNRTGMLPRIDRKFVLIFSSLKILELAFLFGMSYILIQFFKQYSSAVYIMYFLHFLQCVNFKYGRYSIFGIAFVGRFNWAEYKVGIPVEICFFELITCDAVIYLIIFILGKVLKLRY